MTDSTVSAAASLQAVRELRIHTRQARDIHWFVLVVFGALTLGAMPFYVMSIPSASTPGCVAADGGLTCRITNNAPLGGAFIPESSPFGLSRWATVYWVVGLILGFALVLMYYRRRSTTLGVQGRIWPAVTVGGGLFFLTVWANRRGAALPVPDAWIRGTGVLLIVALGLLVLSVLERNTTLGIVTVAFLGLALLSTLYDDANLFQRIGLGNLFNGRTSELPNLLLPGLFLLLAGCAFWIMGRQTRTSG